MRFGRVVFLIRGLLMRFIGDGGLEIWMWESKAGLLMELSGDEMD